MFYHLFDILVSVKKTPQVGMRIQTFDVFLHVIFIYLFIYIQCPPLILAPLINMSKGGCENKSALFILLIFHSKNSQNSNLSLK